MLKQTECSLSSGWMELDSICLFFAKENDSIPHSKPAIFLEITYKTQFFLRTVQEKKNPSALN